jgi:polysaccharide export outer membrane protein
MQRRHSKKIARTAAFAALACALNVPMAWAQTSTSAAAARAAAEPAAEYRLGSGDGIRVTVYQNPDLTIESVVSGSGDISFPLLGTVRIGGLTVSQAEKRIADGLRDGNFVKQPQVSLIVMQVRGNQASVLGQVNRPGRYPIEVADMRITDLLALAGGVAVTGADVVTIVGTRDGKPYRAEMNLPTVFGPDKRGDDIIIRNGDVVWVDRMPTVYIYGEVQKAGAFRLERGMTVMQALATGGGLTLRGTEKGMRVHRRGPDGKVQILQPSMDDLVRDGDVVYVRESLF